jgi:hypothetical protein
MAAATGIVAGQGQGCIKAVDFDGSGAKIYLWSYSMQL